MAYKEPKKRSIRLDDDVYEALRQLSESPNKFLRKVLSADGAFGDGKRNAAFELPAVDEAHETQSALWRKMDRKPLLKPSERK